MMMTGCQFIFLCLLVKDQHPLRLLWDARGCFAMLGVQMLHDPACRRQIGGRLRLCAGRAWEHKLSIRTLHILQQCCSSGCEQAAVLTVYGS